MEEKPWDKPCSVGGGGGSVLLWWNPRFNSTAVMSDCVKGFSDSCGLVPMGHFNLEMYLLYLYFIHYFKLYDSLICYNCNAKFNAFIVSQSISIIYICLFIITHTCTLQSWLMLTLSITMDQQTEEMIHEWQVISVITDQGPYSQNIVSYH